ncbi:MAG: TlpA disulfide reductase family protein, partial [Myxococcota bacterium]|nr:TlpA disulfide reductase family protein [Myxococcota bacterium]
CPHCQKEVPKLEKTHQDYKGRMNVIGLTKLSKGVTAEDVNTFISEKEVSYPMAKENGDVSKHFAVQGIPAAALVKDGKIIWRGHPAGLNDEKLDKLL